MEKNRLKTELKAVGYESVLIGQVNESTELRNVTT